MLLPAMCHWCMLCPGQFSFIHRPTKYMADYTHVEMANIRIYGRYEMKPFAGAHFVLE